MLVQAFFILCFALALSGFISPPVALVIGILFGLAIGNPYPKRTGKAVKWLLQASVVLLGFGMDLQQVLRVGRSGFIYTAIGIATALVAGWLLGRLFGVQKTASYLISAGTAICGGSAIAAIAPITEASDQEVAVAMGTVFVLNSVALIIFPPIGAHFHLNETQFGLWAALAIHDTSSVVGAAAKYGAVALTVGTTVKLARALWIVPLALATAAFRRHQAKIQWPWFIALFCLAALANTYVHAPAVFAAFFKAGRLGLTATLFLIGAGISKQTLRQVGVRPLLQGVVLWLLVASLSLWLIAKGVIRL